MRAKTPSRSVWSARNVRIAAANISARKIAAPSMTRRIRTRRRKWTSLAVSRPCTCLRSVSEDVSKVVIVRRGRVSCSNQPVFLAQHPFEEQAQENERKENGRIEDGLAIFERSGDPL